MSATKTLDVTLPSDREIAMTRVFDAPRALVYDAFTKPKLVQRWLLGPDGWTMPVCEIDLRVGGKWRYVWRNDADGSEFGMSGAYRELSRPDRTVHTEIYSEDPNQTEAVVTTTFKESGGRTTMTSTMLLPSKEVRDAIIATGMAEGAGKSYDRLADLLPEIAAEARA
ncbi:MAG: SRPBCC family protein [Bauldia sp.]|nr:SRPBCC family protein [Bauldia sp.]